MNSYKYSVPFHKSLSILTNDNYTKKKTLSKSFVKSQNFKCHTITILIMKLKKSRIIIVTLKKKL